MASTATKKKVSYYSKEDSTCPVCKNEFKREELLSGGGRLIAGRLTEELRRLYEPSKRYGKVYPLAYEITTCPKCLYSAFRKDFQSNILPEEIKKLKEQTQKRQEVIQKLFGRLDFKEPRNLVLGAATYVLTVDCYHFRGPDIAPTPKKAIAALRAAWLFSDIHEEVPDRPYDKVVEFYYLKSVAWYRDTLEFMQTGDEPIESAAGMLGPDTDQNWAFDGIMYLNGILTKKHIDHMASEAEEKAKILMTTKKFLSKLYGSGKGSKSKPSAIIDMAKDTYDEINKMIEELGYDPNNYDLINPPKAEEKQA